MIVSLLDSSRRTRRNGAMKGASSAGRKGALLGLEPARIAKKAQVAAGKKAPHFSVEGSHA